MSDGSTSESQHAPTATTTCAGTVAGPPRPWSRSLARLTVVALLAIGVPGAARPAQAHQATSGPMARAAPRPVIVIAVAHHTLALIDGWPSGPTRGPLATGAPGVTWRFSTGDRPLTTAPVAGGDSTLYTSGADGVLYALAPDGRVRWTLATGVTTTAAPLPHPAVGPDGTSYWNVRGSVVAMSAAGRVAWTFLAAAGGSPVYTHGHVLFVAGPFLYAVTATGSGAGRQVWRAAIGGAGTAAGVLAPAIGPDGTAFVPSSDGYLYAIGTSGLRRWAYRVGVPLLFSPAIGLDGTVYLDAFARGQGTLYALAPSGTLQWRVRVSAGSDVVRAPNGTVFVGSHELLAVSPRGTIVWRRTVDAVATVTVDGPLLLVPTLAPSGLLALDLSGAPRWRVTLAAGAAGAPVRGLNGRLYVGDNAGSVTALDTSSHGPGRLLRTTARSLPAADLGAGNPPYIVRAGATAWRVTLARSVERSTDRGRRWRTVFTPGTTTFDRPSGRAGSRRYAEIAFLATMPSGPRGLYVGTTGALGDYLLGGTGAALGGLYYSPDGAEGWRALNTGLAYTYEPRLHLHTFGLVSLTFDPVRHGVLYAQTDPAFGSPGHDAGPYRSVDGGAHWVQAARGLTSITVHDVLVGTYRAVEPGTLLVDTAYPRVLFLVAPSGLWRSADAAAHWARVRGVLYTDPASITLRVLSGAGVRAYTDRGIFSSTDTGARWQRA